MSKLRVSIVQYLNTAPLVWGFTHGSLRGKYELSFTVPSQCAEALRKREVDIAIIPAIEYQRMDGLVILPDLAIASKKQVRSLLLVSKVPIEQATRIALDHSSRSTQVLIRILCAQHWKINPEFYEGAPDLPAMLKIADAALLIGDPALRLAIAVEGKSGRASSGEIICEGSIGGIAGTANLYIYDVVEEWNRMTGLPAVLAVWTARSDIVDSEVVEDFLLSRDGGLQHLGEICKEAEVGFGAPASQLERYLTQNINFSLDEENIQGLLRYYGMAFHMGFIPSRKTLVISAGRGGGPKRYHDFAAANRG